MFILEVADKFSILHWRGNIISFVQEQQQPLISILNGQHQLAQSIW